MCTPSDIIKLVADAVKLTVDLVEAHETRKVARYQVQEMQKEAKQKEQDAAYERQEGVEEARRQKLKSILNMGEEKTTIASGNISLNSGTALNIVDDEKLNGELDALITLKDSERKAENYMLQSQQYYRNAALTSYKAKNNFANSIFNSSASFLNSEARTIGKINIKKEK